MAPTPKKQRVYGGGPSTSRKAVSNSTAPSSLPKELLALIVECVSFEAESDTDESHSLDLSSLCLVSKSIRVLALQHVFSAVHLKDAKDVVKTTKAFKANKKGKKGDEEDKDGTIGALGSLDELEISLENLYSSPPVKATLVSSLSTLLVLATSLTSLTISISLPSSATCHPFLYLFPPFPSPLSSLTHLRSFRLLNAAEIWLHDLAVLLPSWPSLSTLELSSLRGDCTRLSFLDSRIFRPRLAKLVVKSSTLTAEMVRWLLEGQTELKWLEVPLPGVEGGEKAWNAVEKVVEGVETLHVWDGWAKPAVKRRTKKSIDAEKKAKEAAQKEGEETDELADGDNDGESDIFEHPPSPLLPLVVTASHLHSLLLSTAVLPSAPSSESFELLLPHLSSLRRLTIEDIPASGLRLAVQDALEDRKLTKLKTVVSVGMKKTKKMEAEGGGAAAMKKGKGEKRFQGVCEKRGVEWVIDGA